MTIHDEITIELSKIDDLLSSAEQRPARLQDFLVDESVTHATTVAKLTDMQGRRMRNELDRAIGKLHYVKMLAQSDASEMKDVPRDIKKLKVN